MKVNLDVNLHHLPRVEGHGNIHVRVRDGKLEKASWEVVETPRYFEVMLKGLHYTSAAQLTARICGICSVGHALCSLRATEDALGVEVPEQAARLRLLAKHGETLASHILHVFFLAAPDLLGLDSVLPLLEKDPELVKLVARLKGIGNRVCEVVTGRVTHPVSLQVGGVAMTPAPAALRALAADLRGAIPDLQAAAELFSGLTVPDFSRETEFVALAPGGDGAYPWIGGELISTDGVRKPEADYLAMTNERVVPDNTTKWCSLSRDSLAVGSLARFNNNHAQLLPAAREAAELLGLAPVCHNPFFNNHAQLVECVHVAEEGAELCEQIADAAGEPTMAEVTPRAGEGTGAVEVPRGILYHHYVYDDEGRVVSADCVIPTTQNNANIHHDLAALVEANLQAESMTDQKMELLCAMLVRSYDPCISCSVH